MKKLLLLLLIGFAGYCPSQAGNPVAGGGKCKKCRNAAPDAMEDFLFAGPSASHGPDCSPARDQLQDGVIAFYRWYLENSRRISLYEARTHTCREDMVPPLNISWIRLKWYAAYILKSYPELDTIRIPSAMVNVSLDRPETRGASESPESPDSRITAVCINGQKPRFP